MKGKNLNTQVSVIEQKDFTSGKTREKSKAWRSQVLPKITVEQPQLEVMAKEQAPDCVTGLAFWLFHFRGCVVWGKSFKSLWVSGHTYIKRK